MSKWTAARRRFVQVAHARRGGAGAAVQSPVQEWETASPANGPIVGPDGAVWFGDGQSLGRFDTAAKTLAEFPVLQQQEASAIDLEANAGLVWFGVELANQIGWSTLDGQANFAETSGMAVGLVVGPNGNVWYGVSQQPNGSAVAPVIGQVSPSGVVQESPTTFFTLDPIVGPDGNTWFGEWGARVGVATPAGAVDEYTTSGTVTSSLIVGPDDRIWYGTDVAVGCIDPVARSVQEFDVGGAGAFGLIAVPTGTCGSGRSSILRSAT